MGSIWPDAEPLSLLVLSGADLQRLLERDALIGAMREAMLAYSAGQAVVPLRTMLRLPGNDVRVLASMPGYLGASSPAGRDAGNDEAVGAKLVSVLPANPAKDLESHYGLVVLFDPDTGRPEAIMDGTFITTARTAAVSAVSVDLLALPNSSVLAVIGAGVQARAHLWALAGIRPFREARVASRDAAHARALAASAAPYLPFPVLAFGSAADAVRDADVVVTATSSASSVIERWGLKPGVHIVAVGSSTPEARELDSLTVHDALLVVDSRLGALTEAGDILMPMREGLFTEDHIHAELGELLAGTRQGRTTDDQITVYKSLGLAVQDLAAARLARSRALVAGVGQRVAL